MKSIVANAYNAVKKLPVFGVCVSEDKTLYFSYSLMDCDLCWGITSLKGSFPIDVNSLGIAKDSVATSPRRHASLFFKILIS